MKLRTGIKWECAPDSALPATDPHGRAWEALTDAELHERRGWCMHAAQHEALHREHVDRARMDAEVLAATPLHLVG